MNTSNIPQMCGDLPKWDCEIFARLAHRAFPASTKFYLSRITGIPARTVERHLDGGRPSVDHALAYLCAGVFGQHLRGLLLPSCSQVPAEPQRSRRFADASSASAMQASGVSRISPEAPQPENGAAGAGIPEAGTPAKRGGNADLIEESRSESIR